MSDNTLQTILILIKQRDITEKECLIQCGINTSFLTDWKNGKIKCPSYDKIVKIARFFDVSTDYILLEGTQTDTKPYDKEKELIRYFRQLDDCEKNIIIGKASELIYNKERK